MAKKYGICVRCYSRRVVEEWDSKTFEIKNYKCLDCGDKTDTMRYTIAGFDGEIKGK